MAVGTLDFAVNVNNTKAFEGILEKSIMRGVVGGMDVAFDTKNLDKLTARQNYEDWWVEASKDAGRESGKAFIEEAIEAAEKAEKSEPSFFARQYDKIKENLKGKLEEVFSWGTILIGFTTIRDKFYEIQGLFADTGKIVGRFAGRDVGRMRTAFVSASVDIKNAVPLAEMKDINELMGEFALEGVRDTKILRKVVPSMERFAYFNGEAASAMIPLLSTLIKTGKELPNLDAALGDVNAGFGKFAGQGLAAIAKLSRFSSNGDMEKLAKGASAFASGLTAVGLTGGETADMMGQLLDPDFRNIPDIFKPFADQMRKGNFDGVTQQMKMLQGIAKGTSDEFIHVVAEQNNVPAALLMSLKRNQKDIGVVMQDAAKEQKKQNNSVAAQYENATSDLMNKWKKRQERFGLVFTKIAIKLLPYLDKAFNLFVKFSDSISGAMGNMFESLKPYLTETLTWLSDKFNSVNWDETFTGLKTAARDTIDAIKVAWAWWKEEGREAIVNALKTAYEWWKKFDFTAVFKGFKDFGAVMKTLADNWELIVAGALTMKAGGTLAALSNVGGGAAGKGGMLGKLNGVLGKMGMLAEVFTAAFAFGTWFEKKFIGGSIGDWVFENFGKGGENAKDKRLRKESNAMTDEDYLAKLGEKDSLKQNLILNNLIKDAEDRKLDSEVNQRLLDRLVKIGIEQLGASLGQKKAQEIMAMQQTLGKSQ